MTQNPSKTPFKGFVFSGVAGLHPITLLHPIILLHPITILHPITLLHPISSFMNSFHGFWTQVPKSLGSCFHMEAPTSYTFQEEKYYFLLDPNLHNKKAESLYNWGNLHYTK